MIFATISKEMKLNVPPGKYVVAVSGGVDSMVLLDLLSQQSNLQLVVAHYEHGIRDNSDDDRKFVEQAAANYGLPFVYEHGRLGAKASEAMARQKRYDFLQRVVIEQGAISVITAHHQDDLLETAVINIIRGTGRRGLSSLQSRNDVIRPLLSFSKKDLHNYATSHNLYWREDETNSSDAYLRNYIRHHVLAALDNNGREKLMSAVIKAQNDNPIIDNLLRDLLAKNVVVGDRDQLKRSWYICLPHDLSAEVMAEWLRGNGITEFDRKLIQRLTILSKTLAVGRQIDINARYALIITKQSLKLSKRTP